MTLCLGFFDERAAMVLKSILCQLLKKYQSFDFNLALKEDRDLQHNANPRYMYSRSSGTIDWKLEGYADYISRGFKNDGRLKEKIEDYLIKSRTGNDRLIVIEKKNGTKQIHSYFKYSLMVQYLVEIKNMNFIEICELDTDINEIHSELIEWRNN